MASSAVITRPVCIENGQVISSFWSNDSCWLIFWSSNLLCWCSQYLLWYSTQRDLDVKSSRKIQVSEEDEGAEEEGVEEEDEEEHGETMCGACGDNYASDFWICCDMCEKWFHGKCVKITPARAEHIKQYKCPSCSNKRARP